MKYTADEIIQYAREENVKFVRLAFCDVYGRQKNISVMASELERAFRSGIAIDGHACRAALAARKRQGRPALLRHKVSRRPSL